MSGAVLLSGGTGLIGGRIVPALSETREVRLLSRRAGEDARPNVRRVQWDGQHFPAEALAETETVVHLAGEPVFGGLPTRARQARLRHSRIGSTQDLIARIAELAPGERPGTLVCASAVGFYGDRGEERLPESASQGQGFLADLCRDWEAAADGAGELGLRVVKLRFGIVLARGAGALGMMALAFKTGLGGRLGSGQQWFPWVHIDDAAAAVLAAVSNPDWSDTVNVVAPNPVKNADLTKVLAAQLGRPAFMVVPGFAVRLGMGPLADELLGSKYVVPERATSLGFVWKHEQLASALEAELG